MLIRSRMSATIVPLALGTTLGAACFAHASAQAPDSRGVYFPWVTGNFRLSGTRSSMPLPDRPVAGVTQILDGDNTFVVEWARASEDTFYTLQEATGPTFADARFVVFHSPATTFMRTGARPGQLYYRLQAANDWGRGPWSATVVADVPSLFIGLIMHWDEVDEISGLGNTAVVGVHQDRRVTGNLDPGIAQVRNWVSFDPNPFNWQAEEWFTTYDKAGLTLVGRSGAASLFAKWAAPWILPKTIALQPGAQVQVAGSTFDVSGPGAYEVLPRISIDVWKLTNRDEIVTFEDDKGIQIKVLPNDEVLWYAADASRLLVKYAERLAYYQSAKRVDLTEAHVGHASASDAFNLPGGG